MVGTGLLVIGIGALAQAVIRENSSWPVVIPGLVLVGVGAGLAMASLTSTAMSAVPWQQAGMAGGALSAFRQLGYAFGIAVLGEVFDSGLSHGCAGRRPAGGAERRPGPGGARAHPRACPGGAPGVRGRPRPRLRLSPRAWASSRPWRCSPSSGRAPRTARRPPPVHPRPSPSPLRLLSRRSSRAARAKARTPNGCAVSPAGKPCTRSLLGLPGCSARLTVARGPRSAAGPSPGGAVRGTG